MRTEYGKVPPAQFVREFEDMENLSLELTRPYQYKVKENRRRDWGLNASAAASVSGLSVLAALLMGVSGRRKQST